MNQNITNEVKTCLLITNQPVEVPNSLYINSDTPILSFL
jgi:hypothetical protein